MKRCSAVPQRRTSSVASVDWTLPDNARLGDYSLSIEYSGDEDYGNDETRAPVRVSRYALPQFSVSTSLDKPYYLPGQHAELKLSADYLFGKPVIAGTVRVVRETKREWNYQTQKYETTEDEKYTSKLDRVHRSHRALPARRAVSRLG